MVQNFEGCFDWEADSESSTPSADKSIAHALYVPSCVSDGACLDSVYCIFLHWEDGFFLSCSRVCEQVSKSNILSANVPQTALFLPRTSFTCFLCWITAQTPQEYLHAYLPSFVISLNSHTTIVIFFFFLKQQRNSTRYSAETERNQPIFTLKCARVPPRHRQYLRGSSRHSYSLLFSL